MWLFLKRNLIVTLVFVVASGFTLRAQDIESFTVQLCMGFIACFVFYVLQSYIPLRRQEKQANLGVYLLLDKIYNKLNLHMMTVADCLLEDDVYKAPQPIKKEIVSQIAQNWSHQRLERKASNRMIGFSDKGELVQPSLEQFIYIDLSDIFVDIDKLLVCYGNYLKPSTITLCLSLSDEPYVKLREELKKVKPTAYVFENFYDKICKIEQERVCYRESK